MKPWENDHFSVLIFLYVKWEQCFLSHLPQRAGLTGENVCLKNLLENKRNHTNAR